MKIKRNKLKDKECVIHFESDLYSNDATTELYGRDIDLQIGLIGILAALTERGYTIKDFREIIDRLEEFYIKGE